jgi:hypothetical protein
MSDAPPTPTVPAVALPGFCFSQVINSGRSFGGKFFELNVATAAVICGKSQQTIRNWAPYIGRFNQGTHRFIISKTRLAAYLRKRLECVPSELESLSR